MRTLCSVVLFLATAVAGFSQGLDLKRLDHLAAKASDTADVTLDGGLLKLAVKFLNGNDPDDAKVKKLVEGLKGIYVKTFEFDKEGEYAESDVAEIRNQLRGPDWSRIVGIHSRKDGETAEIYIKTSGPGGLAIICTDPKELTVVNIVGKIDLDQLSDLGGMGVPKIELEKTNKPKPSANKDDE